MKDKVKIICYVYFSLTIRRFYEDGGFFPEVKREDVESGCDEIILTQSSHKKKATVNQGLKPLVLYL